VNDCLQRSLNGKAIDSAGKEMQAILAYMSWLGKDVPKKTSPYGSGLKELEYLDRPADPLNGAHVYQAECQRCHGGDGGGQMNPDGIAYKYPPLWGDHSYTTAAGMYRLSKIAAYVKENMPYDSVHLGRGLSIGDAWDVGAFVNSQPRPVKTFKQDWPDISTKPPDHPFGPFIDSLPLAQHKYGPFKPIIQAKKEYKDRKLSTKNTKTQHQI
jgi:thiosulfate dehydrogenase